MEQISLIQPSGLDHAKRLRSISATDVAKVLGVHPYESAWDVYAVKTGLVAKPPVTSEAAEIGSALQQSIARMYSERTGEPLVWWDETQTHPEHEWATATPDSRLAQARIDGKRGLCEIKTGGHAQVYRYGPSWSDEYPEEYRLQMAWQCFVTGHDFCDLAVLLGAESMTLRIYRFEPSQEYLRDVFERVRSFWFDHVVTRVPPEIKPTSLADIYLRGKTSRSDFREPTPDESEWIEELARIKVSAAPNAKRQKELETLLKNSIGEASGLLWERGKVSYKTAAASKTTDFKAVAADLALLLPEDTRAAAYAEVMDRHTKTEAGSRRFLFRPRGAEADE